jgi:hypothetical protein
VSDRETTGALLKALRGRYCAPEWALFMEVQQGTGMMAGRSADCVAMNLYPSRGLRVHGVEVKASRGDWLRELRAPEKAEAVMQFCDHWWIATRPGVVMDGELPPTWGLLELHGAVLRQKKAAPTLKPKPMDRALIASMFRRACEKANRELAEAVAERIKVDAAEVERRIEYGVKQRTRDLSSAADTIRRFEEASGLKLDEWKAGDIGKTVKALSDLGFAAPYGRIAQMVTHAERLIEAAKGLCPEKEERAQLL